MSPILRPRCVSALGIAAIAIAAAPALAQAQLPDTTFRLTAGWFLQSADADMRVDGSLRGTDITFDDLGLDGSDSSFLGGLEWRFAERHRIGLYTFNIDREATRTISRNITIGDTTYPVGVSLSSEFKTSITPITYSYSFTKDSDSEFAGTLGIHWSKIELNVNGATSLGGSATRSYAAKVDAPLPLIGLRYDKAFGKNWLMTVSGEYFYFKAGDIKGSFGDLRVSGEYAFTKNFAAGASYTYFTIAADAESSNWKGNLDYTYNGPALYLVGRF